MKNSFIPPFFRFALSAYLLLFILKKAGIYLYFISDYVADFLTLPVVLAITLIIIRKVLPNQKIYSFKVWHVLYTVVLYGFLFEWVFPKLDKSATADPWDLLAYALGGVVFWFWMNNNEKQGRIRTKSEAQNTQ